MNWKANYLTDLEVIRYNSELCDMSNPEGAIYGEVTYLIVQNNDGYQLVGPRLGVVPKGVIKKKVDLLAMALDHGFNPELHGMFVPTHPVYGSKAYIEENNRYDSRSEENEEQWAMLAGY